MIDTTGRTEAADLDAIDDTVACQKLNLQLRRSYAYEQLVQYFRIDETGGRIGFSYRGIVLWLRTKGFIRLNEQDLNALIEEVPFGDSDKRKMRLKLLELLQKCECSDRMQELRETIRVIETRPSLREEFFNAIPDILRKTAHRKYRELFTRALGEIRFLGSRYAGMYVKIAPKIDALEELARKRFSG
jgi:hypothetical protein